jgi:SOS-response transcriptional repressor LexA
MTGAGIHNDDILVVDRSLKPVHGRIVVAILDGEFTVKRLSREGSAGRRLSLTPENSDYPRIEIQDGQDFDHLFGREVQPVENPIFRGLIGGEHQQGHEQTQ